MCFASRRAPSSFTLRRPKGGGEVLFQYLLGPLARHESVGVSIVLPEGVDPASVRIVVDPFNEVLESDETNNSLRAASVG